MAAATAELGAPIAPVVALPTPLRPPVNKWLVALSVTFGTLMATIDSSIVNVAVDQIRGTVGASVEEITWVITGFTIAQVIVMPLTAFLGRFFGQKRLYIVCLGIFLVGSVMCGMCHTLTGLIVCRAIQGFGAGALQPTEQAILRQTFPPKEQGMAMAFFALAIMIGPAIGPVLGGWIVDTYSWPWIFYINLPVGIMGMYMVHAFVHEPDDIREANRIMADKQRKHMDWVGIALMSIGLVCLQYVFEEGGRKNWFDSSIISWLTAITVIALAAFVIRELTATVPAVNLRLLKDRVFAAGTVASMFMFAMLITITFLLPIFMQELLGFDATQSGLALLPRTLVMMFCMPIVGKLYNKIDTRIAVFLGLVFLTLSAWMMSHYTLQTTSAGIVASLLVQGVGFSLLMIPLTTVTLITIPRHQMAEATGLYALFRQLGASFGLAIFATQLGREGVRSTAHLSAHLAVTNPLAQHRLASLTSGLMGRGLDAVSANATALRALFGTVAQQATVLSFSKVFLLCAVCLMAITPLCFLLKKPKDADIPHVDVPMEI